ncbi:hypothetical protein JIN85_16935 [Luteolibacter pohnpeiensis]|uniref:Uncharacterized protein n=1 Tax=Luteolibacter pohnpeiensis TaxID=454153 RepID=A0A934VXQ8_9BACT|nr:hypothetical protein [Luteolibacter pohnpeiensis]MBK1884108.1 hypothetical protein [Luteolibacter pohnpeiensis]
MSTQLPVESVVLEIREATNGQDAYDLWLAKGNVGSYEDYVESTRGPKGDQGEPGDTSAAEEIAQEAVAISNSTQGLIAVSAIQVASAEAAAANAQLAVEEGHDYIVRTKADLPVGTNGNAKPERALVWADPVKANNGTYIREVGASVWEQSDGDGLGRLLRVENKTAFFSIRENFEIEGEEYTFGFFDPFQRCAAGMTKAGTFRFFAAVIAPFSPDLVTALAGKASQSDLTDLSAAVSPLANQLKIRTDRPDYFFTIEDESFPFQRIGFGIMKNGKTIIPGLAIPGADPGSITTLQLADEAVTKPKLDSEIVRETAADRNDYQPDPYRPQRSTLYARTGAGWLPLPPRRTPILSGLNSSGQSLDFRKSSGLFIRGQRYRGTFDPSIAPSITYKGALTSGSSWPPAGTFDDGDFYEFQGYSGTLTIGSDTLQRGDQMVMVSGSWVYLQAPGGFPNSWRDFWVASADGWFRELQFSAGDRLVFMAYQPAGGGNMPARWIKGGTAGEWFRRGFFDPADGFPVDAIDGDLWEATADGEVGGLALTTGDEVIKTGGAWGPVTKREIITVPAGGAVALSCVTRADEWEVRRTDKSSSASAMVFDGRGQPVPSRSENPVVDLGDSMPGKLAASLADALGERDLTTRSYGGGLSIEVEAMLEYSAATGDPYAGSTWIFWQGENNASSLSQISITAERLAVATGSGDGRILHLGMPGRRNMTWNGERLVCDNQEQQLIPGSSNAYAKAREYFLTSWPNNYIDTRAVMVAAADDTPDLQFPGMTEAESAAAYGVIPFSHFFNSQSSLGLNPSDLNFVGYRSDAGLPTGGNPNDYYLRSDGGTVGNLIVNLAGTWAEYSYDSTHPLTAGLDPIAAAVAEFLNSKNW